MRGCGLLARGCGSAARGPVRTTAPRGVAFCLVLDGGFDHVPAVRSMSAQRIASTSPRRAPVNSNSRTASAACRSGCSASAATSRPSSSPDEYRRRWCSVLRSMPFAGLVSRMPQRIARLNIFDIIATARLAA